MTSSRAAVYGVGAALLVAYLAAANMPSEDQPSPTRAVRPAPAGPEALAGEVNAQAARLQARMAQAPVPDQSPRNPFSFGLPARAARAAANRDGMVHAAVAPDIAPVAMEAPLPVLTLMGVAEETTPAGPRRTAVIGGDGDTLYMVVEGQPVGARYKVTKIGADAVELEDLVTKGYRRIAMR
jgi:Tfp pilus assembly protein PilP